MISYTNIEVFNQLKNTHYVDIMNLNIGDCYWGKGDVLLTTVLGSCISVCFWHPEKKTGGLCHFKLPGKSDGHQLMLNRQYGYDAVHYLLAMIEESGLKKSEFIVRVYGGASMARCKPLSDFFKIGEQNIAFARKILKENSITVTEEQVGGNISRKIEFELSTGIISVGELC